MWIFASYPSHSSFLTSISCQVPFHRPANQLIPWYIGAYISQLNIKNKQGEDCISFLETVSLLQIWQYLLTIMAKDQIHILEG